MVSVLPDGWYRVSLTASLSVAATGISTRIFLLQSAGGASSYTGNGTGSVFAWGAQLEQSSTVGEYVPTTSAINSAPRFDHNPTTGESLGLLVEEARTNLWQWSNSAIDGQTWNNVGTHMTLTAGQTSPAGDSTAIRAADVDSATSGTFIQRTLIAPLLTAGTFVSYSIFIKPINIPNTIGIAIFANVTTDGVTGTFTVSGTAITGFTISTNGSGGSGSASYIAYPNGWYRVIVSGIPSTVTMADCRVRINLGSYTRSTGTARFDWYGGQLENNAFASSYIPTTGTAGGATRAADVASITGSNFGVTRTNLLIYSEDFDNATYTLTSATISPNAVVAPNNSLTADTVNSSGTAVVSQSYTKAASSITYTASLFVKGSVTDFSLTIDDGTPTNRARARFNLATGAPGSILSEGTGFSATSGTIEPFPNNWYRITVTTTTNTTTTARHRFFWSGSGTSVDVWGAQLEASSAVTPYIPSTQTFTSRASGASYFDVAGVLRWKPQNLLLRSEEFDNTGAWTRGVGLSVAPNTTISPIGTLTADTITGDQNIDIGQTIAAAIGITYTNSVYVKAGTATSLMFRDDTGTGRHIIFNPSTGVITSQSGTFVSTPTSQPLGNGWYRYSMTYVADATSLRSLIRFMSAGSAQTYVVWGAQLEQIAGSFTTPGEYIPTLGTATGGARNSAYLPDSSGVFRSAGLLLLEEARTNLLLQSENFGTTWTPNGLLAFGSGSTLNALTAPDGQATADLITENTSNSQHNVYQISTTIGAKRFSVFAKQGPGARLLRLIDFNATDGGQGETYFNLSTGAVVSGPGTIQALPDGWYRCSIQSTTTVTSTYFISIATSALAFVYAGDGASGLYLWGAQLEAGAFPTSYIPTTSATVTRAADVSTSTATSIFESSFYNQTEGTVFADGSTSWASGNFVGSSDNTNNNRIFIGIASGPASRLLITTSGSSVAAITVPYALNTLLRGAGGYKENSCQFAANGVLGTEDTNCTIPTVNKLSIGSNTTSSDFFLNGTIRRLTYWPTRFASTTLETITRP